MSFAQDLKASVLQAAMQGKLTEQLEADTPVSELLSDIKIEKERLIAEKKIKKEKPLSAISEDDIPFDIPESWEWVRFGDIVYYNMGKTPPRAEPEWWKNDCPWVSIADMPENGHISKTKEMVSQKAIDEKFNKISPAGTMLMSFKLTVGRVSILDIDAVHNEAIISIYPHCDRDNIIQKYLFMLLPYVANTGDTKNAIKGKTLNNDSIRNLLIPYPPIEEQKRIVRRIEEIMIRINELEAIEEDLKKLKEAFPMDMKAAVLQAAMQGKLTEQLETDSSVDALLEDIKKEREKLIAEGKIKRSRTAQNNNFVAFKDEEEPFEIPDNWRWVHLGCLFNIERGGSPRPIQEFITTSEDGVNWIKIGDSDIGGKYIYSTKEKIIKAGISKSRYVEKDSFLLTNSMSYGRPYILKTDGCIHDGWLVLKPYNKSISQDFLYVVLSSPFVFNQFSGKANGAVVKNLNIDKVMETYIALPSLEEQNRIVAKLEQILPLIADLS